MKVVVDQDRLEELINLVWDCTCECPPIHDFNQDEYESYCPLTPDSDFTCGDCWFNYVAIQK